MHWFFYLLLLGSAAYVGYMLYLMKKRARRLRRPKETLINWGISIQLSCFGCILLKTGYFKPHSVGYPLFSVDNSHKKAHLSHTAAKLFCSAGSYTHKKISTGKENIKPVHVL
jgi:hypothetical protein